MSGTLQDLLDDPAKLRAFVLKNWKKHCETKIATTPIPLTSQLAAFINQFDFSIFRAKQPLEIIKEHAKTRYHLTVFGAPLVDRPPPPQPPSSVAPSERIYVAKLYAVIAEELNISINDAIDFAHSIEMRQLFDRSRITFYSAEGLRELARDQMADAAFFELLITDFENGLFHNYGRC